MLRLVGYPVAVQLGLPLGDHTDPLAPFVPSVVEFYFVHHQFARRYLLRVDGDGRVRVTIPRGGSRREATAFGLRHLNWIAGQRARIQRPGLNADERRGLQARANVELPARLRDLATMHGLAVRDDRPGLDSGVRARWTGDVLVVWKLDRLGRTLAHLVHTVQGSAALGCIKGPSVASKTEIPV